MPEIQDATANMTLGAIKARDIDNLKLLMEVSAHEVPFKKLDMPFISLARLSISAC